MYPFLHIFNITISVYWLMILISLLAGFISLYHLGIKEGFKPKLLINAWLCIIMFGLLGGRIGFLLMDISNLKHPLDLLNFKDGGMLHSGALIVAFGACYIYLITQKANPLKFGDAVAPFIALNFGIIKIACLLHGCCFGGITVLPWAITFPVNSPAFNKHLSSGLIHSNAVCSLPVHPTQIYLIIMSFAIFFFLLLIYKKKKFNSQIFIIFIFLFATGRFFIEFTADSQRITGPFSIIHIISIIMIIAGLLYIYFYNKNTWGLKDYLMSNHEKDSFTI